MGREQAHAQADPRRDPAEHKRTFQRLRTQLMQDPGLKGSAWCARYSETLDGWLEELFARAAGSRREGLALLAVGSYGRRSLSPGSDADLVLVHEGLRAINDIADALWYPIWDSGLALDHSVRTPREIRSAMDQDTKVALGLLDARLVAGDARLAEAVAARTQEMWRRRQQQWLVELHELTMERHRRFEELAFLLEPDLKESKGGLRDLQLLLSLATVIPVIRDLLDSPALARAGEALLGARVELQRQGAGTGNRLLLQDQDLVAERLGLADADTLMGSLAEAGRTVAWAADDAWRRMLSWLNGPRGRGGGGGRALEPGVVVVDDEVVLRPEADLAADPSLPLRIAAASAETDLPISRGTLDRLGAEAVGPNGRWDPEVLRSLVRLLGAGRLAVAAIEALDQQGVWVRYLPEWAPVRNRPQRNAFHRYTVDRHLLEAVALASQMQSQVARPDLLLLGSLFHDIGKGRGVDHTELGVKIVAELGPRLGLEDQDASVLTRLVRHHLLLAEAATRRDLEDPSTIERVAEAVEDRATLELLAALTVADSQATGPAAWGPWKAGLVERLVEVVSASLEGRPLPKRRRLELGEDEAALLAAGRLQLKVEHERLSVAAPDRPGLLACVSGVLSLNGVSIRSASTLSDRRSGMALLRFEVAPAIDRLPDWDKVVKDLDLALSGRLDLEARLAAREAERSHLFRIKAAQLPESRMLIDNSISAEETVVEVRTPDRGPLLHKLSAALSACGVDITCALVSTLGAEAVDVFYVRQPDGSKVTDPEHLALVEQGLRNCL